MRLRPVGSVGVRYPHAALCRTAACAAGMGVPGRPYRPLAERNRPSTRPSAKWVPGNDRIAHHGMCSASEDLVRKIRLICTDR